MTCETFRVHDSFSKNMKFSFYLLKNKLNKKINYFLMNSMNGIREQRIDVAAYE